MDKYVIFLKLKDIYAKNPCTKYAYGHGNGNNIGIGVHI